jgi:hypothetical protein
LAIQDSLLTAAIACCPWGVRLADKLEFIAAGAQDEEALQARTALLTKGSPTDPANGV